MFFLDEIIYGRPFSSTFFRGGAEHPLCQPVQCSYRNFNPCIIVIVIVIITCTCCTYNSNASNTGFVHACSPVVSLPIKVPSSSRPQRFCVSISSALAHCDSSSTPSLSFRWSSVLQEDKTSLEMNPIYELLDLRSCTWQCRWCAWQTNWRDVLGFTSSLGTLGVQINPGGNESK